MVVRVYWGVYNFLAALRRCDGKSVGLHVRTRQQHACWNLHALAANLSVYISIL